MKYLVPLMTCLILFACSDAETTKNDIEQTTGAELTDADREKLKELAKPAKVKRGALEAYFVECVTELMVKGPKKFDKNKAIVRILDELDAMGLAERGRPEAPVRDIVTVMVEDMEAFRPENYEAGQLDDRVRGMLSNLGKSYLLDLRKILDPSLKKHEGKLRRAAEIDPKKVRPGYEAITWNTLGGFTFKKGEPLPQRILDLDGKKVAHLGFMFPAKEYEDIREFLLVESLWTCCFGEPPLVTDVVKSKIGPEKPGLFLMQGGVLVHGTLRVKIEIEDGWVLGIYRIEADHVEAYQP